MLGWLHRSVGLSVVAAVSLALMGGCFQRSATETEQFYARGSYTTGELVDVGNNLRDHGRTWAGRLIHHWNEWWLVVVAYYLGFVGLTVYVKLRNWPWWGRLALFVLLLPFPLYHVGSFAIAGLVFD